MSTLRSLTTFVAWHMRRAWRRHCDIIRLTYDLNERDHRAEPALSRRDGRAAASGLVGRA